MNGFQTLKNMHIYELHLWQFCCNSCVILRGTDTFTKMTWFKIMEKLAHDDSEVSVCICYFIKHVVSNAICIYLFGVTKSYSKYN